MGRRTEYIAEGVARVAGTVPVAEGARLGAPDAVGVADGVADGGTPPVAVMVGSADGVTLVVADAGPHAIRLTSSTTKLDGSSSSVCTKKVTATVCPE